MGEPLPVLLVPGPLTTPRLYAEQLPALWRLGPVTVACPTLVLVGDGDEVTPPRLSTEIAEGIPGARLVVVAGAGHLSPLDQPGQVTRALVAWASGRG